MKTARVIALVVIVIVGLVVVVNSLYVVDMTQQVVITQFGRPIGGPVTEPGLKAKLPFIQKVNVFDKRILEWDGSPRQIPTKDKRYIWIDTFARWRIVDPLKFMQSVTDEIGAQARLDDVIDAVSRDLITSHNLIELVRNTNREMTLSEIDTQGAAQEMIQVGRSSITQMIFELASEQMPRYGIELVDVQLKRINYVEEVREKVYERMISERQRIAERYRSEGKGQSSAIRGQKEKELQRITSEAYRTAEETRGNADAEATRIYADAFGRDPEFYSFLRTLESYKTTLDGDSSLILTTDSDYFRFLKDIGGR
ncbi:MAG: protease modulator HflC [Candidatus Eisenbacteria bacterium]|nr:protease modulator HflC [Candidatus Eisenbacteria bacterium]